MACNRSKREAASACNMSEIEVFRDESPTDSSDPPAAVQSTSDPQDNSTEPVAAIRARRPSRTTAANASKRRSPPSPSPPRQQPPSPASSYASVFSHAPSAEIGPWQNSVKFSPAPASLSHDVQASQISSPSTILSSPGNFKIPPLHSNQRPQRARAANHPTRGPAPIFTPSRTGPQRQALGQLRPRPGYCSPQPHLPRASTERQLATQPSEEPAFTSRRTRTSTPPSAAYSYTQPRTNEPLPYPWPAAPPLTGQPYSISASPDAPPPPFPPPLSPSTKLFQAQTYPNHRPKHQPFPLSSTQSAPSPEPPFSLSTASPLPIPPNALALEPPPVANSIRSQILSEIQNIGTGGRSTPHPSTPLFRTDIPLNHPLKPLLEASLNSILQAVSPRTLQSYLTAWKSFKTFHSTYNLPFPTFSLLAITSFISHLNINKKLQTTSIKGYLSGLQFFHKLLYGSPSTHIANSQTSLLIKGIQKPIPPSQTPGSP